MIAVNINARLNKNMNDAFLNANKKSIKAYQNKIEDLVDKVNSLESENRELIKHYENEFRITKMRFNSEISEKERE